MPTYKTLSGQLNNSITGVYKMTFPNGQIYIGQTRNFKERKRCYSKKTMCAHRLMAAFIEFGYKSHVINLVHEMPRDVSQTDLNNYERLYISQYKECGASMLNIQQGGLNCKHEDSSKERQGMARRGKKQTPEVIERVRQACIGKKRSDETRRKQSEAKMGAKNPRFGKKDTECGARLALYNATVRVDSHLKESTKDKLRLANNKVVYQYSLDGSFIKEWESVKVAEKEIHLHNVSWCATGKAKTCGGYLWRYDKK